MSEVYQTKNSAIPYRVIRSRRRTIGLEVGLDGTVTARIPARVSLSEAKEFVEEKQDWILKIMSACVTGGGNGIRVSGGCQIRRSAPGHGKAGTVPGKNSRWSTSWVGVYNIRTRMCAAAGEAVPAVKILIFPGRSLSCRNGSWITWLSMNWPI